MHLSVVSGCFLCIVLPPELNTLWSFQSVKKNTVSDGCRGKKASKEEAFLLQLLQAPTLKQLLMTAKHIRAARTAAEVVGKDVHILTQACTDVHESNTLRRVLRYTLDMGNFLNAGSNNACASGFAFEDLLKLKEVKGSGKAPGCKSLLHFLAKQLLQVRIPTLHVGGKKGP